MFPKKIKHSLYKALFTPFLLLSMIIIFIIINAFIVGILLFTVLFIYFTVIALLSLKDYLVLDYEEIRFYEDNKLESKVKYSNIKKIGVFIDSTLKNTTIKLLIYDKENVDYEMSFSNYSKKVLKEVVKVIIERNPHVNIDAKLIKYL